MRMIDADKMAVEEVAAFVSAQAKITDSANREDAVQVVRCKDCEHFENATVNAKGFLICPNTGMDIWDECYCAHGERFCD